jgi:hypothetical protein
MPDHPHENSLDTKKSPESPGILSKIAKGFGKIYRFIAGGIRNRISKVLGFDLGDMKPHEPTDAHAKPVEKVTGEHAEKPAENFEQHYKQMKSALERCKISTEGIPSWESVRKSLTSEIQAKALKLKEPHLILIPPTDRQSKIKAIDANKTSLQEYDTETNKLEDNDLWNGGKVENEKKWRVAIVDGVEEVEADASITGTNVEMSKSWIEKYSRQGLGVVNDADTYLTLMIKKLTEGKLIDIKHFTVLNGKNVQQKAPVAYGAWNNGMITLLDRSPDVAPSKDLRLRGMVEVEIV